MAAVERNKQFHMLLSEEERELLQGLADRAGLSASDYLRTTIRSNYTQTIEVPADTVDSMGFPLQLELDKQNAAARRRKAGL